MNTNEFPTIKQMIDAIIFAMNDCNGKCEYHQDTYTFVAVEYVPYPVRDSGGSIDSIGFEPVEHSISFQEGYHYWVAMMDFIEEKVTPIPAPVTPRYLTYEDDDLPF
jgi:hypothetical protein